MKRYLEIINKFGVRKQMKKLHEEIFEFLESIDNYEDSISFDADISVSNILRDNMIDELADVLILLTQFIAYFDIEKKELDEAILHKLERTEQRIKDGYYDKN